MTNQELRRLNRGELLEMLIKQIEENEILRKELEQTQALLRDRRIALQEAGSIAQAALSLNGVFQAADAAVQQYVENIKRLNEEQEALCRDMREKAEKQAEDTAE